MLVVVIALFATVEEAAMILKDMLLTSGVLEVAIDLEAGDPDLGALAGGPLLHDLQAGCPQLCLLAVEPGKTLLALVLVVPLRWEDGHAVLQHVLVAEDGVVELREGDPGGRVHVGELVQPLLAVLLEALGEDADVLAAVVEELPGRVVPTVRVGLELCHHLRVPSLARLPLRRSHVLRVEVVLRRKSLPILHESPIQIIKVYPFRAIELMWKMALWPTLKAKSLGKGGKGSSGDKLKGVYKANIVLGSV